jgi:hypothetical protein
MWREEKVIDVANRLEFERSGVQVNTTLSTYSTFCCTRWTKNRLLFILFSKGKKVVQLLILVTGLLFHQILQ